MKRMTVLLALLLAVCFVAETASAQNRKAGINAASFLKIGVGARQAGLGSAATSVSGDVTNIYWNPAGVALTGDQTLQASFTYNKWFADLQQNAFAASYRLEDIGTFAIGVMTFGLSDIPADRDVYPGNADLQSLQIDQLSTGTYDYMDILATLSYSRYVTDRLALGVSAKYISEKIDDQTATGLAFDIGSVYHIGVLGWSIGARISNLGSDIKFYEYASPIPLTFSIGTSMVPYSDDMTSLLVTVDAVKPQDGIQYYFAGGEFTFMKMISIRGGYKFNYSGADDGGSSFAPSINTTIEGFTVGAGFKSNFSDYGIGVDYAYTQMDILDAVHRVTLSFSMK